MHILGPETVRKRLKVAEILQFTSLGSSPAAAHRFTLWSHFLCLTESLWPLQHDIGHVCGCACAGGVTCRTQSHLPKSVKKIHKMT